jgi:hypothetical protein
VRRNLSFVQKKEGHKAPFEADNDSIGDAYCFVAIERYTRMVLNFALGRRSQATTDMFIEGRRAATARQQFQISTDGFKPYLPAITTTLSAGTARWMSRTRRRSRSWATPIPTSFARAKLSDKTSRSECPCAASRG